jgi:IS605 OrfB family transposase
LRGWESTWVSRTSRSRATTSAWRRDASTVASRRRSPGPRGELTEDRRSAWHRRAANRRRNALHRFSRKIVNQYQKIVVGDVSSPQLTQTRMAKSVLDSGCGMLRTLLQSKGQQAGRTVQVVSERNTSCTCSSCGSLTGPHGVNGLPVRRWVCCGCGESHERDVTAAKNILRRAELPASVHGNEPSILKVPPNRAPARARQGPKPQVRWHEHRKIRSPLTVLGATIGIATVSNQRPYTRVKMPESLESMLAAISVERSSPRLLLRPQRQSTIAGTKT